MITSCLPGKPLHSIFSQFVVPVDLFGKISWVKQSAEAGLAGLSEREMKEEEEPMDGNQLFYLCTIVNMNECDFYFSDSWGGCKCRQADHVPHHMCKTWLQKVHGGWDMGR